MGDNDKEKDLIDFFWKVIIRYDSYYNYTNTKSAVIATFNIFIVTYILIKSKEILCLFPENWKFYIEILLALIGIFCVISVVFTFLVINPFLKSKIWLTFTNEILDEPEIKKFDKSIIKKLKKIVGQSFENRNELDKKLHKLGINLKDKGIILNSVHPEKFEEEYRSIVYFGDVSKKYQNYNQYLEEVKNIIENKNLINELSKQTFVLSKGLDSKFVYAKYAIYSTIIQTSFIFLIGLFKVIIIICIFFKI